LENRNEEMIGYKTMGGRIQGLGRERSCGHSNGIAVHDEESGLIQLRC
jgi:hypothetical protein